MLGSNTEMQRGHMPGWASPLFIELLGKAPDTKNHVSYLNGLGSLGWVLEMSFAYLSNVSRVADRSLL